MPARGRFVDIAALKREARHKKTPAGRLEELARHPDTGVQLAVASHPGVPAATLEYLGGHGKFTILKAVARNPSVPASVLEKLSSHRQNTVRQAVAESNTLTESLILRLARDPDEQVRFALAMRSHRYTWNTQPFFEILVQDSSALVRATAASHCRIPHLLERFAQDAEWRVVSSALRQHALPLSTLIARLEASFDALNTEDHWSLVSGIVQRPDLSETWLERFARHPNATVRLWIVKHPRTPDHLILRLARDKDWGVLSEVARRHQLPVDLYWDYARHPRVFVRLALVNNPFIPREIVEVLANDSDEQIASLARNSL
jgi:hypothetical protein